VPNIDVPFFLVQNLLSSLTKGRPRDDGLPRETLAGIVSLIQVNFVGDATIYSLNTNRSRELMHEQIIHNQPPEGGWRSQGAGGTNIRIAIPHPCRVLARHDGDPRHSAL
jgi:hypothetical protein